MFLNKKARGEHMFKINQKAFTLIEVLASVLILTLIIFGSMALLNFTNTMAKSNNEKIVAVNLAKATLERINVKATDFIDPEIDLEDTRYDSPLIFTQASCKNNLTCENLYQPQINDKIYEVEVYVSQDKKAREDEKYSEKELGLLNIKIIVNLAESDVSGQAEGYIDEENLKE